MDDLLTPTRARELRRRNAWSLQMVAQHSGINKAYLSEFETGQRKLPEDALRHLAEVLEASGRPGGSAAPRLALENGHYRLVFDQGGKEHYRPREAFVEWVEDDGSVYRMYVGDRS